MCVRLAVKFEVLFLYLGEWRLVMGAGACFWVVAASGRSRGRAQVSATAVRWGVDELGSGQEPLGRVRGWRVAEEGRGS